MEPLPPPSIPPPRRRRPIGAAVLALGAALTLGACGGSDIDLPPLASEGRSVARGSGCAACHGRNGDGGVGPAWVELYGSTVELDGGERVVADRDYLRLAITDPKAQLVDGYTVPMPENNLDADEVEAVLAYIEALQ